MFIACLLFEFKDSTVIYFALNFFALRAAVSTLNVVTPMGHNPYVNAVACRKPFSVRELSASVDE